MREAAMTMRFVIAFFATAVLASASANAGCVAPTHHGKHHRRGAPPPCVSFDAVPDISQQIVAAEPNAAKPHAAQFADPTPEPYSGPTVGFSKMVRRAPTVGYRWSIE